MPEKLKNEQAKRKQAEENLKGLET